MGAVDVEVGCPHRLSQPIGPRTRLPCPACIGRPDFPRVATALTIDMPKMPRVEVPHVKPPTLSPATQERIGEMCRALNEAAEKIAEAFRPIAAHFQIETVEPLRIHVDHAASDRNTVRMIAEETVRIRSRGMH